METESEHTGKIVEMHDNPYELDGVPKDAQLIVHHYEDHDYEGSGWLIALLADGKVQQCDLSHCSCYGPTDSGNMDRPQTVEEFKAMDRSDLDGIESKVRERFLEELKKL
jgi:hypothetical protein